MKPLPCLALLAPVLALGACATTSPAAGGTDDGGDPGSLEDGALVGEWTVERIRDRPVVDLSPAFLTFGEDGSLAGNASCNQMHGTWRVGDGGLQLSPLAVTLRAGPPALMEQEQRLLDALALVQGASFDRGSLVLRDATGGELVRASPRLDPARLATIYGSVFYRERIALAPGHALEVVLEDASRADAPANVVARTSEVVTGQVPIAFALPYDTSRIRSGQRYVLRARLIDPDGRLVWTSDTAVPVLEDGEAHEPITIELRRATN